MKSVSGFVFQQVLMSVIDQAESSGSSTTKDSFETEKDDIWVKGLLLVSALYFLDMISFNFSLETLASSGWMTSKI